MFNTIAILGFPPQLVQPALLLGAIIAAGAWMLGQRGFAAKALLIGALPILYPTIEALFMPIIEEIFDWAARTLPMPLLVVAILLLAFAFLQMLIAIFLGTPTANMIVSALFVHTVRAACRAAAWSGAVAMRLLLRTIQRLRSGPAG
ncbi:MAG: hypothetical protein ACKVQQ_14380 [Burkholderiales bacterium]